MSIKEILTDKNYMSEIMVELPSNCLLNKGITGAGGTTVEINSQRNSIILVPTIELIKNKTKQHKNIFGVYGNVTTDAIQKHIDNHNNEPIKIMGTYDSFIKIDKLKLYDYFLLIDEYHILFNNYCFRNSAILPILKSYKDYSNYCFMSATPLNLLEEIKDLDIVHIKWSKSSPVNINIVDTFFTNKTLISEISKNEDVNYHIFLNSVKTIKQIVDSLDTNDYKIVCSNNNDLKDYNKGTTYELPKKYNFYTSSTFEGCDIIDPIGRTIILCDTNIATTMLDISTLVRQICGRLRNSKYKNEVTLILNTNKHRYLKTTEYLFSKEMDNNIKLGKLKVKTYNENILNTPEIKNAEQKLFNPETYFNLYLNWYKDLYFDDNLITVDKSNFYLVNEIYGSTINVISEIDKEDQLNIADVSKSVNNSEYQKNKYSKLIESELIKKVEWTLSELQEIFIPLLNQVNIGFTKHTMKKYFPPFKGTYKMKSGIRQTYYKFTF